MIYQNKKDFYINKALWAFKTFTVGFLVTYATLFIFLSISASGAVKSPSKGYCGPVEVHEKAVEYLTKKVWQKP